MKFHVWVSAKGRKKKHHWNDPYFLYRTKIHVLQFVLGLKEVIILGLSVFAFKIWLCLVEIDELYSNMILHRLLRKDTYIDAPWQ